MGSKGSATTKQSYSLPPEFQQAYKKSIDMATSATSQPYQAYQGQLVAGLNPTQLQGISNVNAAQGMALPAIGRGIQLTERAAQGITPELYNQFYSPYVRDVADTTFANMMESAAQQRSGLKGGAIQAGAFGGDRAGIAAAEMARQQQLGLGQTMSGIYNQGYGQAMQLAGQQAQNYGAMGQQLAGLGVGAQGSVLQGAQAQLAAGAQQQATDQAQLQAAYEQWMQRQAYPYQQAQFFANIAQGLGSGAGGTSTTSTPGPSLGSQILGGIGAIGSIFGASDERIKENIEAVGELNDGQTVYRYNFKGDPKTQIGLLAQEVETRNPGAVAEANGIKMVDYRGATDNAASMGGLVTPDMQRAAFAGGGVPYYPYETVGFVPEGKIGRGGRGIPEAPPPFEDKGLAEDWKAMKPLTEEQVGGLKALADKLGLSFDKVERAALGDILKNSPDAVNAPKFEDEYPSYSGFASGGVAGRNGYLFGGEPTMEDAMDEAGLSGAEYEPPSRLLARESGGDFGARNAQGYVGRGQFGEERLADARNAGVIPADMTPEQFRLNPDVQKETEAWHFGDINDFIDKSGLAAYEGKTINGIPVTREGMVNVAHLGGKGGLVKFLSSEGQYNPADANGTSLSDYLAMAAEGSGVAGANIQPMADEAPAEEPRSRFSIDKLIASEDNPSIIESIMGRRLSPEARAAVMNASFAMLAGRSPFMGVNIGEAGKVGMQTYYNALQQKRELAKQEADIGRLGFEAETGRMTVDVQERNAQRQLAALILPIIRNYMAMGQPVPPQYLQMLNQALPPGSPERERFEASAQSPAPAAAAGEVPIEPVPGVAPIPEPGMPAPEGEGTETVTPPEEGDSATEDALVEIYNNLPQEQNPYYWDNRVRIAENAGNPDLASQYREKAAEIRQRDFERGYFLIPGQGRVAYPGKLEQQQAEELNKLQTAGAYDATSEQTKRAQSNIQTFQTAQNALEAAAEKLAKADTGQFAEAKSYLVTALNSIGVPQDAEALEKATTVQELRKIFSQILFSGGLKDKIGSQIAASELEMYSRGFGDVNLEPGANRYIVGTMRGLLEMERKRAADWLAFTEESGEKPLSRREIARWEQEWNAENPASDFVKSGIGSTPVKGEIDWKRWNSDPEYRGAIQFTPGYQYVMPKGEVKVYTGNPEDKYFVPVDEYGG